MTAEELALLPDEDRERFIDSLTDDELLLLRYEWSFWARPDQLVPPGAGHDWDIWAPIGGRGSGKTRCSAEAYVEKARTDPPGSRGLLIGATMDDARQVMIEGESGILECCPPDFRAVYWPGLRKLVWPNGSYDLVRSADRPDRLRGPQHHRMWGDEFCAWRFPALALEHALKGLRSGRRPWGILSSTPRPIEELFELVDDPRTVVTGASSYANLAHLSDNYRAILDRGKGSAWHQQEVLGAILRVVPGALWTQELIHSLRVYQLPEMQRVVVGVDPPKTSTGDEAGIVVAGLGVDGHGYTMADRSRQGLPHEWGRAVLEAAFEFGADCIVIEANTQSAETLKHTIKSCLRPGERCPRIKTVRAKVGKLVRAEPVFVLYTEGRWHHYGVFGPLEGQMTSYVPGVTKESPDRLDAHVYTGLELFPLKTPERMRAVRKIPRRLR